MATRAADQPGDRANDKAVIAAFRDSLDSAKRSGAIVIITRADNDFETFRWENDAWVCQQVRRGGSVMGFGS